jgi:hypothetical protein
MKPNLDQILLDGAEFVKKEFGLELQPNILTYYSDSDWNKFCEINDFKVESEGIYIPGANKAYVKNSPYIASNIFHEVYGHALFCEYSIPGKILVEKQKQGVAKDSLIENTTLFTITGNNLADYEGFAMWMESTICKETGRADMWEEKKKIMHPTNKDLWTYFVKAEKYLTRKGLMKQMGFQYEV